MSTNQTIAAPSAPGFERITNVVLWILQIAAAAMLALAGYTKLAGTPDSILAFEAIGVGQWFRYLTGALEVGGEPCSC